MASIKITQTSNFGRGLGDKLNDITFDLYDTLGNLYNPSLYNHSAIYEMPPTSGIYGSELTIDTLFSGSIVWKVEKEPGSNDFVYATEEVKIDQKMARYIHTGNWIIDESTKQMVFYADDGVTEIARYNLKDRNSNASIDEIFERILVR